MVKNEQFTFERDIERDGYLILKNAKTLDLYHELRDKQRNVPTNCFYAFSTEQFKQGLATLKSKGLFRENESLGRTRMGLFGYRDWLDSLFSEIDRIDKEMADKCDINEIYCFEYNNHECMYSDDSLAYSTVVAIFGIERVRAELKRMRY